MEQTDSKKMIKKIAKSYEQRTNQINKIQKSIRSMKNQASSIVKKSELGLPPIVSPISNVNKISSPLNFNVNKISGKQQHSEELRKDNNQTIHKNLKDHYLIRKLMKNERSRNSLAFSGLKSGLGYDQQAIASLPQQNCFKVSNQSSKQHLQQNKIIFTHSTHPRSTQRRFINSNMSTINHLNQTLGKFNSVSFKCDSPQKYSTLDDQISLTSQIEQALMRTQLKFSSQKKDKIKKQSLQQRDNQRIFDKNIQNFRYQQRQKSKTKKKEITLNQCIPNLDKSLLKSKHKIQNHNTISHDQQNIHKTVKKRGQTNYNQPTSLRSKPNRMTQICSFQLQYYDDCQKYSPWENNAHQFELGRNFFQTGL